MAWGGTEVFCEDRVCGWDCWLWGDIRMDCILERADGLLLEDVARQKEECSEYEDYLSMFAVSV